MSSNSLFVKKSKGFWADTFSPESTLPKSFSESLSKLFLWISKQPFIIHFFLASCNVCPMVIPEILLQTQGADYWQLIHIKSALNTTSQKSTQRRWKAHIKNITILWQIQRISLKLTESGHWLNHAVNLPYLSCRAWLTSWCFCLYML